MYKGLAFAGLETEMTPATAATTAVYEQPTYNMRT